MLASAISVVAADQENESTVLIRRVVPANFHKADFDSATIERILASSLNRATVVEPEATLSGILQEQFNVSQSWTPAVYEKVESHVRALNDIQNPKLDLKSGQTLKLPDLPRTSQIYLKQRPRDPHVKISIAKDWDPVTNAYKGTPQIGKNASGTAETELQIRILPLAELQSLPLPNATRTRSELIENYEIQVMQERMTLTLADGEMSPSESTLLTQSQKSTLSKMLALPPKTKPILVIFDDAIPMQKDFFRSAEFVINASREIRKRFGLQDTKHRESEALSKLENSYRQGTLFCDEDCEYPKLKLHSAMIRESLKELQEIDTSQRVEVIYLPVNAAQPFSNELLSEILNVTLLADSLLENLALIDSDAAPSVSLKRPKPDYSSIAPQVETILKPSWLHTPLSPYKIGDVMTLQTDRAIVDGIVNFLWLYSMASQRPHFLSMSWSAPNLKYPTLFRPNGYGIWLAAAGNNPLINVHTTLRQFAARSSDPGDVLVVGTQKAACGSSTITTDTDVLVFGLIFPGRISKDLCGTSFSTPRLGWFLAAFEAIKGETVKPGTAAWNLWRTTKRARLINLQNTKLTGEARFSVSPMDLLEEANP